MCGREERFGDQAAHERPTIQLMLQLLHQLDGGYECTNRIQAEPGYRVSHGRNGVLRTVGDSLGDLQHFSRQTWIAANDFCEGIGARGVSADIEDFLAGRPQGRDRIRLRIEAGRSCESTRVRISFVMSESTTGVPFCVILVLPLCPSVPDRLVQD